MPRFPEGERNVLADALSRNPDPDGESFEHLVPDAQLGIPVGPGSPPSSDRTCFFLDLDDEMADNCAKNSGNWKQRRDRG